MESWWLHVENLGYITLYIVESSRVNQIWYFGWKIPVRNVPQFNRLTLLLLASFGPVHTNPFSNENGAVLLRIRLSSTLQRRKRSPKTEPFENAFHSGAIWKRYFLKTLFSSVDGENDAIWKRWRHQNHSTVSILNGGQALPCSFNCTKVVVSISQTFWEFRHKIS